MYVASSSFSPLPPSSPPLDHIRLQQFVREWTRMVNGQVHSIRECRAIEARKLHRQWCRWCSNNSEHGRTDRRGGEPPACMQRSSCINRELAAFIFSQAVTLTDGTQLRNLLSRKYPCVDFSASVEYTKYSKLFPALDTGYTSCVEVEMFLRTFVE